jgi:hypothetical protein
MKQLTICAFLLMATSMTMAQNGGQFPENGSVKLEYAGGGKVKIYNKQSCESVIKVNDGMTEALLNISGNSYSLFTISNGLTTNFTVKAKTTTNCGGTDFGLVELFIASLPVTFTSINAQRISGNQFWVNFSIADPKNVKQYNVQRSVDNGRTWQTITVLWPEENATTNNYSIKVNLTNK